MAASDEDKKSSVPKFSSFKPKKPAPVFGNESESPAGEENDSKKRGRRSSKHRHSPKHRHGGFQRRDGLHRKEEHQRSRDSERARRLPEVSEYLPEKSPLSSVPGLFVIDTKGDPLVRKYGLDQSKIPFYRRHGGGKVLGTTRRLMIHRDGPVENFSLLFPGEGPPAVRGKDGLLSKGWQNRRPVKLRARDGECAEEAGDYISLENPRKRKRAQADNDSSDGGNEPSWKSIEAKAKGAPETGSDTDDGQDSLSELADANRDSPLKWKSIQLNRQTKDHPDDVDAWLELVDHQDTLLRHGETIDQRATENTAHSFAEIKVHMLESALTHAPCPEDRQRVLVYLMREGVKVWNRKTATKRWSQVADDERHNFALWKTHLDFSMSSIATVQFEDVKQMLHKRLHDVISRSGLQSKEDVEEAIYVFTRATRFFHDAGYRELAVAAWQGLLELNFFRPECIQSQNETLNAFRDFWEREVPRIGEADAQGWGHYFGSGGSADAPEPLINDEEIEDSSSGDACRAWGAAERFREQRAKMPARTIDDGIDDDPFRVVMYSDIEPWLFVAPTDGSLDVTRQLIDAFLLFCGLPPAFRSSDWTETAYHDPFLTGARANLQLQPSWESKGQDLEDVKGNPPSLSSGNCRARIDQSLLFGGSSWFRYFGAAGQEHTVDASWVETTLKHLVYLANRSGLALYYLGMCFAREPTGIREAAKALLKRYPTNIQLYSAYALAEFTNGNFEIANKVLASAVESPSLSSTSAGVLLFKTWSWIELEKGDKAMAAKRLCASVDGSLRKARLEEGDLSPAAVLKARHVFSSNAHQSLCEGKYEEANNHMECLTLLSYLEGAGGTEPTWTCQGNISAAMTMAESMSSETRSRGSGGEAVHELILQFASRILYLHATKGPFRRAYVRKQLSRFVEMFPRNTIFLYLLEWADARIRIFDETRQMVYDKVLVGELDCVSSRIFAIQHELARGNANSTQAAFEHAVSSNVCKRSIWLWISYMRFCHSQKQLRTKARDVFYRALGCCPWSKEVMMEAFVTLPDELRSVYSTMTLKGLRVHVDLDAGSS